MDRVECMRAFVEAVRVNGFAAAARKLDVPRSRVSKQIQALEEMLGVQLMLRTTRSLSLTAAGAQYYEAAQNALAALDEAEERARAGVGRVGGNLRINAPHSFGTRVLAPLIPEFHDRHPHVELHISLTDQQIDPVAGGFDLTIRIAELNDSSLAARTLMRVELMLVASPGFVRRHGLPTSPDDLLSRPFISYGLLASGRSFLLTRGEQVHRVSPTGPVIADSGDLLATLAEAGVGIAMLPGFIIDQALEAGRLVRMLPQWKAPSIAAHALFAAGGRVPLSTRRFIDFLVERLDGTTQTGDRGQGTGPVSSEPGP